MSSLPKIDPSPIGTRAQRIHALRVELESLSADVRNVAAKSRGVLDAVPSDLRTSATNLLHYLALRRHDLRELQPRLSALGLSSLGRPEGCVLASVDAICAALRALDGNDDGKEDSAETVGQQDSLDAHTSALFGPVPAARNVRIMVTVATEAAHNYTVIHELVRAGMDCMRINCAHDDARDWRAMIDFLRRASRELGRPCRVAMDLGGPKLRTGPLEPGPAVLKIRPSRDVFGRVTAPAGVWVTDVHHGHPSKLPPRYRCRPMVAQLRVADAITFTDARGAHRVMKVADIDASGVWMELGKTSYVIPGTTFRRVGAKGKNATALVRGCAPREAPIVLRVGDILIVNRSLKPGRPATYDGRGRLLDAGLHRLHFARGI